MLEYFVSDFRICHYCHRNFSLRSHGSRTIVCSKHCLRAKRRGKIWNQDGHWPIHKNDCTVSNGNRRFYRTLLLGMAALGALVWMAMDQFGISCGEIGELFLGAVLAVGLVIGAAAVVVLLWVALS